MTEYIKKHYRLILMSVFAALVCFGYQAFNSNIRIDTEELINHPGSTLGWLTIGRFGLVLLKRMLGLGVHRTIKRVPERVLIRKRFTESEAFFLF